jgi:hypothetical protein
MGWVEEKKTFLQEPLQLTSLSETRQRLNVYGVSFSRFFLKDYPLATCRRRNSTQLSIYHFMRRAVGSEDSKDRQQAVE